ncbi:MoaD/ThiS family protein [Egicoccus halophilus]|uniref:MoaD family protein n=1 Tax=Egicoccus halophilus TaxID=1670830 RepID=A0A8J3AFX5_9ACTN|nr:MoaD/ThiS family protein [Egicoccus halophilus]GGI07824.1 MoaD family protein [Egicoccus halophilus]
MPTVRIPTPLRKLTDGQSEVAVEGDDLRTVVGNLDAAHPGLGDRLLDENGQLRRFVNVFVRDEDVRFQDGLDTRVEERDTVSIVPAVAGGA